MLTSCSSGVLEDDPVAERSPAPAAPVASPSPTPPAGEQFSLVATGDVLLHKPLWHQAKRDGTDGEWNFAPMMDDVRPYVESADVGLCHLETPLAPAEGPYTSYPSFSGPPMIADALAEVGYDVCSTASNHTFDKGGAGVDRTLDKLDEVGLKHTGSARSAAEAKRLTMLRVNGVKVAFLSYTYGFNGIAYPSGQTWRANLLDEQAILDEARRARKAGAEVVVASLHWGTEYQQTPSDDQAYLAPKLARSGQIDLLISHHAHVVEPVQKIGRTWVVYGLGNLLADHDTPGKANAEGLLTRFTFSKAPGAKRFSVSKAEYVPLLMTKDQPHRVLDVRKALQTQEYGSTTRARLQQALRRTTKVVESMGGVRKGLVPAE
ncbi:CapA family protein [Kineosporia succinea]|uniref:CapA family protein n=1 Tax=Kineosporia succinea TaxID=84632 RepID=UPI0027D7B2DB|nr:CapA family protein [Kineosporia succinea]